MDNPATVTVALPLHRSAPWVDNIVANVGLIAPSVTEIIVSDRTSCDDAIDQLRQHLDADRRVRFVTGDDGLAWEQHCQSLIEMATGEFFMWMPHDDIFDANWVPVLADALARNPDSWLAFGRRRRVEIDGRTPFTRWPPEDFRPGRITPSRALDHALAGQLGVPFRGLSRRCQILDAGVRLEQVGPSPGSDAMWVLGVALHAPLVFDPGCTTLKRYYDGSTHSTFTQRPGDRQRSVLAVVNRHAEPGPLKRRMQLRAATAYGRGMARAGWKRGTRPPSRVQA